jgi:hypothetical protein
MGQNLPHWVTPRYPAPHLGWTSPFSVNAFCSPHRIATERTIFIFGLKVTWPCPIQQREPVCVCVCVCVGGGGREDFATVTRNKRNSWNGKQHNNALRHYAEFRTGYASTLWSHDTKFWHLECGTRYVRNKLNLLPPTLWISDWCRSKLQQYLFRCRLADKATPPGCVLRLKLRLFYRPCPVSSLQTCVRVTSKTLQHTAATLVIGSWRPRHRCPITIVISAFFQRVRVC